jgi:hypothetical protein
MKKGDRVIVHCDANTDKHGRVFDTLCNGMLGVILDGDIYQWYYDPEEVSPEPTDIDISLDRITDQRVDDPPEFTESVKKNAGLLQRLASDGCEADPAEDGPETWLLTLVRFGYCNPDEATRWLGALNQARHDGRL